MFLAKPSIVHALAGAVGASPSLIPRNHCFTSNGCQSGFGTCQQDGSPPTASDDGNSNSGTGLCGLNTSGIARTKLGQVEYGGPGIYSCTIPGDVALTYHDGPASYIDDLLDLLNKYNASATFMIAGNNNAKGEIDNATLPWASTIMRIYTDGHQITSHTWSHADLCIITLVQSKNDMYKPEIALHLGNSVIYFDLDTADYLHDSQTDIQKSEDTVDQSIDAKPVPSDSCLVIGHDIHQQTAYSLTEYMLQRFQGRKFVTIGECLGDPKDNWDRADSRTTLG
ncbi:glycoside hydrolase/deacetylase [Colletotrichum sublineola]|nr:glycoside hydrolase/deacetylase [Colletotrichum sublineola]